MRLVATATRKQLSRVVAKRGLAGSRDRQILPSCQLMSQSCRDCRKRSRRIDPKSVKHGGVGKSSRSLVVASCCVLKAGTVIAPSASHLSRMSRLPFRYSGWSGD